MPYWKRQNTFGREISHFEIQTNLFLDTFSIFYDQFLGRLEGTHLMATHLLFHIFVEILHLNLKIFHKMLGYGFFQPILRLIRSSNFEITVQL